MLPLTWWGFDRGPVAALVSAMITLLGIVAFVRMGHGRWFRSRVVGVGKAILLMIAVQLAGAVGGTLVIGIGLLGASAAP